MTDCQNTGTPWGQSHMSGAENSVCCADPESLKDVEGKDWYIHMLGKCTQVQEGCTKETKNSSSCGGNGCSAFHVDPQESLAGNSTNHGVAPCKGKQPPDLWCFQPDFHAKPGST